VWRAVEKQKRHERFAFLHIGIRSPLFCSFACLLACLLACFLLLLLMTAPVCPVCRCITVHLGTTADVVNSLVGQQKKNEKKKKKKKKKKRLEAASHPIQRKNQEHAIQQTIQAKLQQKFGHSRLPCLLLLAHVGTLLLRFQLIPKEEINKIYEECGRDMNATVDELLYLVALTEARIKESQRVRMLIPCTFFSCCCRCLCCCSWHSSQAKERNNPRAEEKKKNAPEEKEEAAPAALQEENPAAADDDQEEQEQEVIMSYISSLSLADAEVAQGSAASQPRPIPSHQPTVLFRANRGAQRTGDNSCTGTI